MKKTYQGTQDKAKQKFEVIGKREMLVEVPLPMVEVWEEMQAQVEQLTGQAGLRATTGAHAPRQGSGTGQLHAPAARRAAAASRTGRNRRGADFVELSPSSAKRGGGLRDREVQRE